MRASATVVAAIAAAGLACAPRMPRPAAAGPPSRVPADTRATWVWDEATVLGSAARDNLLAFARAKSIGVLFVQDAAGFEQDQAFEALATLVQGAARQGASVTLVGGDPSWALAGHHGDALQFLARAQRIDARLAARRLPRGGRILFDVEPYLLPGWRTAGEASHAAYAELLRLVADAGRAAGLGVWHTIPFWFPTIDAGGRPLDEVVLERSSGIVVMAYRNRPDDVEALAIPVLARAASQGKPVIVAVETMCVDPPHVTFCGQTAAGFHAALEQITLGLRASTAFAGLAVHKYASWAALERGPW
jgi:hypothetical protein